MKLQSRLILFALYLTAGWMGLTLSVSAQTSYTWANGVAGGDWSTATNWTPNGTPGNRDSVFFTDPTGTVVTNLNITLNGGLPANNGLRQLDFNSSSGAAFQVNLQAPLTLSNGGNPLSVQQIHVGGNTSAADIYVSGSNLIAANSAIQFLNDSANGALRILEASSSSIFMGANQLKLTITNGGTIRIEAPIEGVGSVVVDAGSNGGIVTLAGANLYTGNTQVKTGTLNILGIIGVPSASLQYRIDPAGTLAGIGSISITDLRGKISPGNATLPAGPVNSIGTITGLGSLSFGGGATYIWDLGNASGGTPGTDWDLVSVTTLISGGGVKTVRINNLDPSWSGPVTGRAYKIIGTTVPVPQVVANLYTISLGTGWGSTPVSSFRLQGRLDGMYLVEN